MYEFVTRYTVDKKRNSFLRFLLKLPVLFIKMYLFIFNGSGFLSQSPNWTFDKNLLRLDMEKRTSLQILHINSFGLTFH